MDRTQRSLLSLFLLIACGVWAAPLEAAPDRDTFGKPIVAAQMPQLTGRDANDALDQLKPLEALGHPVQVLSVGGHPPGTVARQEPGAGTPMLPGMAITLHVGIDPLIETIVPRLQGMRARMVLPRLREYYVLRVQKVVTLGRGAPGRIVATEPQMETRLPVGGVLTVQISARGVRVPELLGRSLAEAEQIAAQAGIQLEIERRGRGGHRGGPSGRGLRNRIVIAQFPTAGERVLRGSVVTLQVQRQRPQPQIVTVPQLVGMNRFEAIQQAKGLGFDVQISEIQAGGRRGRVIRQYPDAGRRVSVGTVLQLQVTGGGRSDGPIRPGPGIAVIVPNVVGQTSTDAMRELSGHGLGIRVEGVGVGASRIVRQSPQAGSRVARGTRVTVELGRATGALQQRMPRVIGLTREVALQSLRYRGFSVRLHGRNANTPGARITGQSPREGTFISRDQIVTLRVD